METTLDAGERPEATGGPIRAAQYLRKSDEHQKYSTENQSAANHDFAARRGIAIVRTYADEGLSGLSFERRDALKRLIADVQGRTADFEVILVYDVSRWGRFQDPDEAAYYEHLCKRAGIRVVYCAEPFENDGSPTSTIIKGLKRAMAGEFSRELSVKVFAGQSRLARLGYKLGGAAGYGLRRLLIDQHGVTKGTLAPGQWKSITTDRILLVPGPPNEIATVRLIFSLFVHDRKHERQIAAILNERGVPNESGRRWRHNVIGRMLRNEKYIGNSVWNRSSFKLQQLRVCNDPKTWIRVEGSFEPIVDRGLFEAAQAIFQTRGKTSCRGRPLGLSDAQMLEALKELWRRHGHLSRALVDKDLRMPSAAAYYRRFGTLKRIYQLIGYTRCYPKGTTRTGRPRGLLNEEMLDALRRVWREHGYLSEAIIAAHKDVPHPSSYFLRFGSMLRAYELIGFTPDPRRIRPPRFPRGTSNDQILDALRQLLRERGRLSKAIIDRSKTLPCHGTIERRFGGLLPAYQIIGYKPQRRPNLSDKELLDALRRLWSKEGYLSQVLIRTCSDVPSNTAYYRRFGGLSYAYHLIGYTPKAASAKAAIRKCLAIKNAMPN